MIPAGDQRSGVPLGLGWCFLLITGHTSFLSPASPRESSPLTWTLYFPKSRFPRRTLQDPPRGGVQTAGLFSEVSHPSPPRLGRRKNPVCHFVTPWTALWKWTSTAGQRYLADVGPHSREKAVTQGRGEGWIPTEEGSGAEHSGRCVLVAVTP